MGGTTGYRLTPPVDVFAQNEPTVSTASGKIRRVGENYPYLGYLVGGNLTTATAGVQVSSWSTQTTGITSKSSALKTAFGTTLSWPGLEGRYIDQFEASLVCQFQSTAVAATTVGYFWQIKNSTGSTWQSITAVESTKGSTAATPSTRTVAGYRLYRDGTLATGYNKLPINIRLRFFAKSATAKAQMRVKNSSYVRLTAR